MKIQTTASTLSVHPITANGGVTGWEIRDTDQNVLATSQAANKGKLHRMLNESGFKPSETVFGVWHRAKNTTTEISAAAAALGRKGGAVKSEAKAAAVRENGKKGGRPRKNSLTVKKSLS